ncbi:MAG: serine/threonine-protein phosphatase [Chloroflexi bacterium]|nr:serine/threonine-protein phosphatase [Chloroflexota bacterium]
MIPSKRAHLHVAALSHPGMKGKNNEDRFAVTSYVLSEKDATPALFALVADGIGGHRAGEVAAEMVVDYVSQAVAESDAKNPLQVIKQAVEGANRAIVSQAESDNDHQGMGATCACAWVIGDRLFTASVGDSRIYLLRGATIQQLTTDHTWIQEAMEKGILTPEQAREHPNVHVIRRFLGSADIPEVDFRMRLQPKESDARARANQGMRLQPGDTLLLCSDGLTDLVWNDEILETIRAAKDLQSAAQALIDLANERGGHDNITVILLSALNGGGAKKKLGGSNPLPWIVGGVVAFLVIASALAGLLWYLLQPTSRVTPEPTLGANPPVVEVTPEPLIPTTPKLNARSAADLRPDVYPLADEYAVADPEVFKTSGFLFHSRITTSSGLLGTMHRNSKGSSPMVWYQCGTPAGMKTTLSFSTS